MSLDFSRLLLVKVIHAGKFGNVWKAELPNSDILQEESRVYCVKAFSRGPQQDYFYAERDIYSVAMMRHANIVDCFGWEMRPSDGLALLVLEYCPLGTLRSFISVSF